MHQAGVSTRPWWFPQTPALTWSLIPGASSHPEHISIRAEESFPRSNGHVKSFIFAVELFSSYCCKNKTFRTWRREEGRGIRCVVWICFFSTVLSMSEWSIIQPCKIMSLFWTLVCELKIHELLPKYLLGIE